MTKPELEAFKNAFLASSQPITAAGMHRPFAQKIIDELYDAVSRGAVTVAGAVGAGSFNATDGVLVGRAGALRSVPYSALSLGVTSSIRADINQASHGFGGGDVLTINGSGAFEKISDVNTQKLVGIVLNVYGPNSFQVGLDGYMTGLGALVPGSIYYATNSGTINVAVSNMPVLVAVSASSGYMLTGRASGLGAVLAASNDGANYQIKNIAPPSDDSDAVDNSTLIGRISNLSWKQDVNAASTGPLTLSGVQNIDGITGYAGMSVLVRHNTLPAQNGIFTMTSGAWTRRFDANYEGYLQTAVVIVNEGTVNARKVYQQKTLLVDLTTDQQVWDELGSAGVTYFKGLYTSSANLISAHPTGIPGDYAYVDVGVASDVELWAWDNSDTTWKKIGTASVVTWSTTVPGTVERSTTAEAQNIVTRYTAGSSNSSNDDGRTPSEKGLVEMLLSFWAAIIAAVHTWAAIQTFTLGTVHSNVSASMGAFFDGSKKLVSSTVSDFLDWLGINPDLISVSESSGIVILNMNSLRSRRFNTSATASANFEIQISNTTNARKFTYFRNVTGTITVTCPSSFRMDTDEVNITGRWNSGTRVITIVGSTASPFEFSGEYDGSVWLFRVSNAYA